MAERRKLIVAANRAPVSYARDDEGNRVPRRGGGGLVTALRSVVSEHDVTVVRGKHRDYSDHHPGPADVGLLVEVAEASLAYDQGPKKRVYARERWRLHGHLRCSASA